MRSTPRGRRQRRRAAHQRDARARVARGARHRVAHLAGAGVGDRRAPCRSARRSAPPSPARACRRAAWAGRRPRSPRRFPPPRACAPCRPRRRPGRRSPGPRMAHAVAAQRVHVALRRRIVPHLHVHRRRHQQRALARQAQRGQQVVGKALRQLGEEIARWPARPRSLAVARQLDVRHVVGHARIPQVGRTGSARTAPAG